jgi:hypothetical protein
MCGMPTTMVAVHPTAFHAAGNASVRSPQSVWVGPLKTFLPIFISMRPVWVPLEHLQQTRYIGHALYKLPICSAGSRKRSSSRRCIRRGAAIIFGREPVCPILGTKLWASAPARGIGRGNRKRPALKLPPAPRRPTTQSSPPCGRRRNSGDGRVLRHPTDPSLLHSPFRRRRILRRAAAQRGKP